MTKILSAIATVAATAAVALLPAYGSMSYSGTCAQFAGSPDYMICVPEIAPDGNAVADIYEDGSASYESGAWTFDPDTHAFRAPQH